MADPTGIAVGVLLAVVGSAFLRYPRKTANLEERLDAIGSTRRAGAVEAADWKVAASRVFGGCLVAVGGLVLLFSAAG